MDSTYLSSGQAARRLGISNRTLLRAVRRAALQPAARSPGGWLRFRAQDVDAYARALSPPGPGTDRPLGIEGDAGADTYYKLIADLTADFAYSFAVEANGGRVLEWMSGAFEAVTGYSVADMRTAPVQQNLIFADDLPIARERTRVLLAGQPSTSEYRIRTKTGELRWVRDYGRPVLDPADGRLVRIVGAARDITEQKLAEQEARRGRAAAEELASLRQEQIREAQALAEVSAALASALDSSTVYQVILTQAARVLPFDHAEIAVYRDGWVVSVATLGGPEIPPDTPLIAVNPNTSTWRALTRGEHDYLEDTAELSDWDDIPPWVGPYRIRSMIIVPLLVDGVLIGSFKVNSYVPHFYTERHIHMATVFGERAVLAVRNARLYAAEQARARAAEDLAQLRSDFLASVSHELRTPLAAIIGFGELLQARWASLSESKRLEHVNHMVLSANRQQQLVENLLQIGKIESARVTPTALPIELSPLLEHAVAEVKANYPGQSIVLQGPKGLRVLADVTGVIQILVNLLDNAAKYSPEGSPIAVHWLAAEGKVILRVIDRGPGVPEQGRDRLFTQFGRMSGSLIRAGRVGTGLGLHISRSLAEAMGGDLDLESTKPRGSTFRLRLPLVPPGQAECAQHATRGERTE